MSKSAKYLLLMALFCLALLCFFVGSVIGAIAFISLGFILEVAFWGGIFNSTKKHIGNTTKL